MITRILNNYMTADGIKWTVVDGVVQVLVDNDGLLLTLDHVYTCGGGRQCKIMPDQKGDFTNPNGVLVAYVDDVAGSCWLIGAHEINAKWREL